MKTSKRKRVSAAPAAAPQGPAVDDTASQKPVEASAEASADTCVARVAGGDDPTIALASSCTVKGALLLREQLTDVVEATGVVTIDVHSLERIDTAGVQLLCVFVRERLARNRRVAWSNESSVLNEAARLLGVQALLFAGAGA